MQEIIGNFKVVEKLGEGGMGEVYRGLDTSLEREVAIKLLRSELSSQPNILERFRTEAVALARLHHPNIAMLHAFHQDSGQAYMVMEFVPGETLADLMRRKVKIPWREALGLTCQVLSGLEHAHAKNIVHRDLKPTNIMLTPNGDAKLMDFGIARILERSRLTQTGYLIGTLQYMSPEQVQGKEADGRTDIYSLGIVLYEMLIGRIPFDKSTDYEIIKAHVEEAPRPPSEWLPDLEPAIEQAILKALAKNPSERFSTAAEFRQTLLEIGNLDLPIQEAFDRKRPPKTRVGDVPVPVPDPTRLWTKPGVLMTGLLVVVAIGLAFWFIPDQDPLRKQGGDNQGLFVPPIDRPIATGNDSDQKGDGLANQVSESTGSKKDNSNEKSAEDGQNNQGKDRRRPDFIDPFQPSVIDPKSIGISPVVEVVEEDEQVAPKINQKSKSSSKTKVNRTPRTDSTKAKDKKNLTELDFNPEWR